MDFIDSSFASLSSLANNSLPGVLTNLNFSGIIPGGILIFYSSNCFFLFFIPFRRKWLYGRVVFLMDKIMRKFGLSGKKVLSVISGTACAIPAIMAEILKTGRTINHDSSNTIYNLFR
jgi:ferrous iron transport protein B